MKKIIIIKNKYTQFLKGIGYILIVFLLTGCQMRENNHSMTFIEDETIEYSSDFKVSDLIVAVDEYSISDFKLNDDDSVITLPNDKTISINTSKKEIELDTIKFEFRYFDMTYSKTVLIQDTTAPTIDCKDEYEVELGNEYFNLENLIKCEDNYTASQDIELFYNGSYDVETAGNYEIEILAYDGKKNKATKNVTVTVKEEEQIVIQVPSTNSGSSGSENASSNNSSPSTNGSSNGGSSENNSNSNGSSGNNSAGSSTSSGSHYQPASKTFTIDTYSSFDECLSACQSYINECMTNGYQGRATAQPIKRDGVYIGYEAIFN